MSSNRCVALALALLAVGWTFSCSDGEDPPASPGESLDASTSDASPSDAAVPDASDASDASPSDASTSDASDAGCPVGAICDGAYNYAFVTSTDYAVTELGGVQGADAKCNERAKAAGLPGEYVAWLSSSTSNARDRLGTASGWLRTDRRPFAASADELFEAKIRYPLAVDELGATVPSSVRYARTGTLQDGTVSADKHCANWSPDSGGAVETGDPFAGNRRWTTLAAGSCQARTPIYCLGKDHATPLPPRPVTGRRAFASSAHYAPNGLAQADAICQGEAAGVLTGAFKALLATTTASAISRFSTAGATWVRPDGVVLWETAAQAAANAPLLAPPVLHADQTPSGFAWRWLGAPRIDVVGTTTCADWESSGASVQALAVQSTAAGTLSAAYAFNCDTGQIGLICLEE